MRSRNVKKRQLTPDTIYKSKLISRFVNFVMLHGKKSTAEKIVYGALEQINVDRKEALRVFEQAIKNVMPKNEVRSRRVSGATYQVPYPVRHEEAKVWLSNGLLKLQEKNKEKKW